MAKKTESTFVNMLVVLFLVTAIAALALGGVYNLTKEPIEIAKRQKLEAAIGKVLPEFDEIEEFAVMPETGKDSLTFFKATKNGEWIGTAIKTYTDDGFSGRFWIIVGLSPENKIFNTSVLEHKETPGLGDKMDQSKADWSKQFIDQDLEKYRLKVTKDGGDVDAITAATISSRGFCLAMEKAYSAFKKENNNQ